MHTIPIACLGLSHNTAPLELRERLRCTLAELGTVIRPASGCQRFSGCREFVLLSTCNRVELYAYADPDATDTRALLTEILTGATGVDLTRIPDYLYHFTGMDAVNHLCRVASGLESLVLGEQQILGQVSAALQEAADLGTAGAHISMAFRTALRAGKKARTRTSISQNPASLSSVAIAYAQQKVGDLANRRVLVVGLGEMGNLTLKALRVRGIERISLINRTLERARATAEEFGYELFPLSDVTRALFLADIVITATASPDVLITAEMVRQATAGRDGRELVVVDIAVPRNVDPSVGEIPNVHLCDTTHLRGALDEALAMRQKEIPLVEAVIEEELNSLRNELQGMSFRPVITELRQKAETIRQRELGRALRHMGDVDSHTLDQIQHFSRSLVNKLLHEPTTRLREEAASEGGGDYEAKIRMLFGLLEDREGSLH